MGLYEQIAGLPVEIDAVRRERLAFPTPMWVRVSTVVVVSGGGLEGRGEDISYAVPDQDAHARIDPPRLAARGTFADRSAELDRHPLVPVPPSAPEVHDYRRWAYESAILDLALRQAGIGIAGALGREAAPVRFCVSPSDPDALAARYPDRELKIDARADWTAEDMARISGRGTVRVVDLKGHYSGEWNRHPDDPPAFSAAVAAAFPEAVLEDPTVGPGMERFLADNADRISFDAPVHSLADLAALPPTRWCNIKPSRFGTAARLLECVDHCLAHGVRMYGGGQFEIGPGRAQIQALAGALYPDGPNDVAPGGYNAADLPQGLPASPLPAVRGSGLGS